jgi:hypothetical protein
MAALVDAHLGEAVVIVGTEGRLAMTNQIDGAHLARLAGSGTQSANCAARNFKKLPSALHFGPLGSLHAKARASYNDRLMVIRLHDI